MLTNSTNSGTWLILAGLLAVFVCSQVRADETELIENTTVAETALTFAVGPAAKFANTVNGRTHQQTPLTTYQGYQYVTYFDAERRVCLGRRKLPSGTWEIIQFTDYRLKSNDSHRAPIIGICDKDGTIHMAFDHHASQLNYRISQLGAAHHPDSVNWTSDLFGEVTHTLGSVTPDIRVTYPRFFSAPNGNLMLYYRAVTSGNGDGMIEEYDGDHHDWSPGLGKFIARDIGTYSFGGNTSPYRCPYMNSLSYADQRLHASWVWRERFEKTDFKNQHDLCYAYSDDHGRTWHNSEGSVIAKTGTDPIHLDSPGVVVASIPVNTGLSNQNTHYAYADGSIHIVLRHLLKGSRESRYHHYWRSSRGVWGHEALPVSGTRPKLVGSNDRSLVLVYCNAGQLFITKGQPNSDQTAWRWDEVNLPQPHSIYGDALMDLARWEEEKVLSIYSQEVPSKITRTGTSEPIDGIPSPLKVVDYRFSE
jgi:hypothetical protein